MSLLGVLSGVGTNDRPLSRRLLSAGEIFVLVRLTMLSICLCVSDFYKNLAHTHNIRFHEAVSALRKEICSIMAEHHNNQAAEEQARVDQINSDIGELYPQSVVRLINTNAKRKAAELNNSRPAANNQRNRQSRGRGGGRGRGPARNRSLRNGR